MKILIACEFSGIVRGAIINEIIFFLMIILAIAAFIAITLIQIFDIWKKNRKFRFISFLISLMVSIWLSIILYNMIGG